MSVADGMTYRPLGRRAGGSGAPGSGLRAAEAEDDAEANVDAELGARAFLVGSFDWGNARYPADDEASLLSEPMPAVAVELPWHLEQCIWLGFASALDHTLHFFTLLPMRMAMTIAKAACTVARGPCGDRSSRVPRFRRSHVFDALRLATVVLGVWVLSQFEVSWLYHSVKGESAPIKLYVLFNILEVVEKLFASLGTDILGSLHRAAVGIPGLSVEGDIGHGGSVTTYLFSLVPQVAGAAVVTALHAATMFVQIICLSAALNAHNNALPALLVSNNFVELKASVFKRFQESQVFQITCSDIVERFRLALFLGLAVVQEVGSADGVSGMVSGAAFVFVMEIVVDYVKHYFLCKFNGLDPANYDLSAATISYDAVTARNLRALVLDPTHNPTRRLGLATLPLTCVIVRFLWIRFGDSALPRLLTPSGLALAVSSWLALLAFKLFLNTALLAYGRRYHRLHVLLEEAADRERQLKAKAAAQPRPAAAAERSARRSQPPQSRGGVAPPSVPRMSVPHDVAQSGAPGAGSQHPSSDGFVISGSRNASGPARPHHAAQQGGVAMPSVPAMRRASPPARVSPLAVSSATGIVTPSAVGGHGGMPGPPSMDLPPSAMPRPRSRAGHSPTNSQAGHSGGGAYGGTPRLTPVQFPMLPPGRRRRQSPATAPRAPDDDARVSGFGASLGVGEGRGDGTGLVNSSAAALVGASRRKLKRPRRHRAPSDDVGDAAAGGGAALVSPRLGGMRSPGRLHPPRSRSAGQAGLRVARPSPAVDAPSGVFGATSGLARRVSDALAAARSGSRAESGRSVDPSDTAEPAPRSHRACRTWSPRGPAPEGDEAPLAHDDGGGTTQAQEDDTDLTEDLASPGTDSPSEPGDATRQADMQRMLTLVETNRYELQPGAKRIPQ